ncbi:MAG: hypothetical protein J6386_18070 [Candidatus Synoicihabitans palmerolidicus]|nr:hypothetical protein [Candidatus Synoicihabitans palmerolidicus]
MNCSALRLQSVMWPWSSVMMTASLRALRMSGLSEGAEAAAWAKGAAVAARLDAWADEETRRHEAIRRGD